MYIGINVHVFQNTRALLMTIDYRPDLIGPGNR